MASVFVLRTTASFWARKKCIFFFFFFFRNPLCFTQTKLFQFGSWSMSFSDKQLQKTIQLWEVVNSKHLLFLKDCPWQFFTLCPNKCCSRHKTSQRCSVSCLSLPLIGYMSYWKSLQCVWALMPTIDYLTDEIRLWLWLAVNLIATNSYRDVTPSTRMPHSVVLLVCTDFMFMSGEITSPLWKSFGGVNTTFSHKTCGVSESTFIFRCTSGGISRSSNEWKASG